MEFTEPATWVVPFLLMAAMAATAAMGAIPIIALLLSKEGSLNGLPSPEIQHKMARFGERLLRNILEPENPHPDYVHAGESKKEHVYMAKIHLPRNNELKALDIMEKARQMGLFKGLRLPQGIMEIQVCQINKSCRPTVVVIYFAPMSELKSNQT